MAKQATKRKPKPEPQPNPEAVARYEVERRRAELKPPTGAGIKKRTTGLEALFLEQLAAGSSVTKAAWVVGIHRLTAYQWRRDSEATIQDDKTFADDFCVRWDAAVEAGVDLLEDEARRRAAQGVERPVYQGGVMVGTVTEYSDTLMATLLKGNRPGKFNVERHELSGPGGKAIPTSMEIEFVDSKVTK